MLRSLLAGARLGLISGIFFAILSVIVVSIFKLLMTWPSLVWPDSFPSAIPEFILSGSWVIIVIVSFTLVGAAVGGLRPARYELL